MSGRPDDAPLEALHRELVALRKRVEEEGEARFRGWLPHIKRTSFLQPARNLADYLALRQHDLGPLQRELARLGLSSLGRAESRVRGNLDAVLATLDRALGLGAPPYPPPEDFFAGEGLLQGESRALFGPGKDPCILVTLPEDAALDPQLVPRLVRAGMTAARINLGHGHPSLWEGMVAQVRRVEQEQPIPILMDLSGPRLRLATVRVEGRIFPGHLLELTAELPPHGSHPFQATLNNPTALEALEAGHRVFMDEGRLEAIVEEVGCGRALLRVVHTPPKGFKLRPEKGVNLPDTPWPREPLTPKDLQDLDFAAQHADLLGYSFVEEPGDIERLLGELALRNPKGLRGLVLKVETSKAVRNLPELVVRAAGSWPMAIMIARGDLAVELGYEGLAEMQEEILWLAEAACIPVIWATQVLDHLVKKGTPSRAEVSDAVLAARAECVMLNKGPFLEEAIRMLREVLPRIREHQYKKTPKMRRLEIWS